LAVAGVLIVLVAGGLWLVIGSGSASRATRPVNGPGSSDPSAVGGTEGAAGSPGSASARPSGSVTAGPTAGGSTAGGSTAGGSAGGKPVAGGSGTPYRDPTSSAASWVAANPTDARAAVIKDRIVSQPQARWFTSVNVGTVQADASRYVGAANAAGQVPVLAVYGITNRDCGGASSGGATNLSQYQSSISGLTAGLGSRRVVIILEPDSVALQTCLSGADLTARDQALSTAVQTIKSANANAKVYLDGGHSTWNGAADQANRLVAAGIGRADGFYTNVSNFNSTPGETSYGRAVIAALVADGVSGKHQVIDTSRNGGAAGDWCGDDNTDRRLGQQPTLTTGDTAIDAYLWVKRPGEADGCAYGAGSFQPALAYSLAQ
jgi:endoglucanase